MRIAGRTFTLPQLPPWAMRWARYAGYPLFGLFVFLFVLYLSLPWDRVKDRLEIEAAAAGMDLRIESMGPAFLLGLKAKSVTLRTRPTNPTDKPMRFVFEEIVAHPSLLGLLGGHTSASFDASAFGGDISGAFSRSTDVEANLTAKGIDLGQIPGLENLVKLPMGGVLRADGEVSLPKGHFAEGKGEVKIECKGCTIGDGKAKLVIPGDAFLQQGVTVPKVALGNPEGKIVIEKGAARMTNLEGHSPDIDLKIEGEIALRDPWQFSTANLCLAFRPTPALVKREAVFELLGRSLDQNAKRSDGYYSVRVTGRLDAMYFMPARCGAGGTPGGPTTVTSPVRPGGVGFQPPAPPPMAAPPGAVAPPPGTAAPGFQPPPPPPPTQPMLPDAAPAPPPSGTDTTPRVGAPVRGAVLAPPSEKETPPPPPPEEPQQ